MSRIFPFGLKMTTFQKISENFNSNAINQMCKPLISLLSSLSYKLSDKPLWGNLGLVSHAQAQHPEIRRSCHPRRHLPSKAPKTFPRTCNCPHSPQASLHL